MYERDGMVLFIHTFRFSIMDTVIIITIKLRKKHVNKKNINCVKIHFNVAAVVVDVLGDVLNAYVYIYA